MEEQSSDWYTIDTKTSEDLRKLLTNRKTKVEKVIQNLSTSVADYINNFADYVTIDNKTLCTDLFHDKLPYIVSKQIGQGKVGTIRLLTKSNNSNINLIIKSIPSDPVKYLSLRIIDHPGDVLNPWNNYWRIIGQDGTRKILAVGGDNFANQTSLHLILNIILGDNPHYIHQYDAFYCNKIGNNIIEYSNAGDLHQFLEKNIINDELIFRCLKNVLAPLSLLKHPMYNFNHSDLKAKNVFVNKSGSDYILKIADYDKSSITWNGYRFYNWTHNYGTAVPIEIEKDSTGVEVYILSSIVDLQLYTMHNPYGIPMSYDIYTFILSLFGINNVWKKYVEGELPQLKSLMHQLFTNELYYIIMGKIAQNPSELSSLGKINKILNGVHLQYDLSYVYELVDIRPPPLVSSTFNSITINVSDGGHLCTNVCSINNKHSSFYKTCPTNTYSKTSVGLRGPTTTLYNWDYCK